MKVITVYTKTLQTQNSFVVGNRMGKWEMNLKIGRFQACRLLRNREIDMLLKVVILLSGFFIGVSLATETSPRAYRLESSATSSNSAENRKAEKLDALAEDLNNIEASIRMGALQQLGASQNPKSRDMLLERLKQMPQPRVSSNSNQKEKVEVLKQVLPKLQASERIELLFNVLREEMSGLKEAASIESENYFPKDLARFVIASLSKEALSTDIRQELEVMSCDHSIAGNIRGELLAVIIPHDLMNKGILTPVDQVKFILDVIPVRPNTSIPWDIYNNPINRIAYSETEAFRNRQVEMRNWFNTDDAIRSCAYEILLQSYGLTSVIRLVAALDIQTISKEKRDYLALLATEILRKRLANGAEPTGEVIPLIDSLANYVKGMVDAGAFSRRAIAAANLNMFCEKNGLPTRIVINAKTGVICPDNNF
ncbi:MAG: hypothetical protein R6X19_08225 [Kiritimatiellia bacterium]